jgi:hypothetical protein
MSETLTPEVLELLQGRNTAHVATLMKDGTPHVSPVWIAVEGDRRHDLLAPRRIWRSATSGAIRASESRWPTIATPTGRSASATASWRSSTATRPSRSWTG